MSWTDQERVPRTFRFPKTLDDALTNAAAGVKGEKTKIVLRGTAKELGWTLEEEPVAIPVEEPKPPGLPPRVRVDEIADFAAWLSKHSGLPIAICREKVKRGTVTVGGEVYQRSDIAVERLEEEIRLDGETLEPVA